MAMEGVLDGVRRAVHKWINTVRPITSAISKGDTTITITSTNRFEPGDQVMVRNASVYETGLVVDSVTNDTTLVLTTPVLNDWIVDGNNTVLIKAVNEMFVQGIYIGDPDVIPRYPAITVNGISRGSEWLTLESTTERYEVEINVFVKDSTHEDGYRGLMKITDMIQKGLKRNITPLVTDYDITSLTQNADIGDVVIRLADRTLVETNKRIILENVHDMQENWVTHLFDENPTDELEAVQLFEPICINFTVEDTTVIVPHRFIYNSWPHEINYGKIHKGELLKAASIRWFAQEEEVQVFRRNELKLN